MDQLRLARRNGSTTTIASCRRHLGDVKRWYQEWLVIHHEHLGQDHILLELLSLDLAYAELWTICVALTGSDWSNVRSEEIWSDRQLMPGERELAFSGREAANRCINQFVAGVRLREHVKCEFFDV